MKWKEFFVALAIVLVAWQLGEQIPHTVTKCYASFSGLGMEIDFNYGRGALLDVEPINIPGSEAFVEVPCRSRNPIKLIIQGGSS